MTTLTASITIRPAYADDELALAQLAALDSADAPPPAPRVIAEVDGALRVALSLWDGSAIADPFFATADIVALLRAHAVQVEPAKRLGWKFGWHRSSRAIPNFAGR